MSDPSEVINEALQAALGHIQENEFSKALGYLNAVQAINPNHPDSLCLRGIVYLNENQLSAAAEYFKRTLDFVPNHQTAKLHLDQIDQQKLIDRSSSYVTNYISNQAAFQDFPRNIGIETVGRCNANCSFCPHESLDRKFSEMDDALFDKIIGDLAEIPANIPINIFPNLVNEPFMDRKIFPRLAKINQCLPHATIEIFTNLNILPRDFFEKVAQLSNLRPFNVSFNAANESEYNSSMKIDFQRTVDNLEKFMNFNRREKLFEGPLVLSRVASLTAADDHYVEECARLFSKFSPGKDFVAWVKNRANWLGESGKDQSQIPKQMPCNAWFDINIFCDGLVPHCCMDATGEYAIGNVKNSSILEIYNNPKFSFMRTLLTAREGVHPCNECSLLQ